MPLNILLRNITWTQPRSIMRPRNIITRRRRIMKPAITTRQKTMPTRLVNMATPRWITARKATKNLTSSESLAGSNNC